MTTVEPPVILPELVIEPRCQVTDDGGYQCELAEGHALPHRAFIGATDEWGPTPERVWGEASVPSSTQEDLLRDALRFVDNVAHRAANEGEEDGDACILGDRIRAYLAARPKSDALRTAVDAFLTKHPAQIGSKSGRPDYGNWVTAEDLWALHVARLAATGADHA